jgi:hypothetical protein
VGEVCNDCARLIKLGKQAQANANRNAGSIFVTFKPDEPDHLFPLCGRYAGHHYKGPDTDRILAGAFWRLIALLGEVVPSPKSDTEERVKVPYGEQKPWGRVHILISDALREAAQLLYDSIQAYSVDLHKRGREDGENLLARIASNELTIDEINERSIVNKR